MSSRLPSRAAALLGVRLVLLLSAGCALTAAGGLAAAEVAGAAPPLWPNALAAGCVAGCAGAAAAVAGGHRAGAPWPAAALAAVPALGFAATASAEAEAAFGWFAAAPHPLALQVITWGTAVGAFGTLAAVAGCTAAAVLLLLPPVRRALRSAPTARPR
ncbi:hypothetical protein [Nocardiopsis trehalosi]|uniref:hypothetical protein n=1 Tax=Nocardiopsis trehalosi TaxID=109329 RepID=UPI00082AB2FE|nr:hypothetical protein [Nocardiopsis trehalosi]